MKGEQMTGKRKQHTAAFKAQVASATIKVDRTVNELADQYGVHPTLINGWKKHLPAGIEWVFATGSKASGPADDHQSEHYGEIGRFKMELEWLKESGRLRLS